MKKLNASSPDDSSGAQLMDGWQAYLFHLTREGRASFDGEIKVEDDKVFLKGTVIIGDIELTVEKTSIQLNHANITMSDGLTGRALSDVIQMPDIGIEEIDLAIRGAKISAGNITDGKLAMTIAGEKVRALAAMENTQ